MIPISFVDSEKFAAFTDEELLSELLARKRLLNVEAVSEMPTRYLSEVPLGYTQRKTIERMIDPLTDLALRDKISFKQSRSGNRFDEMTNFHVKMFVVVKK